MVRGDSSRTGVITTPRPGPPLVLRVDWRGSACCATVDSPTAAGSAGRAAHQRRVTTATATPSAAPAATSVGQCTPICTREYATASATGAMTAAETGSSSATPAVNAAAEAECPDGNEDETGGLRMRRTNGTASPGGRRRGNRGLATPLANPLAIPVTASPRSAARRPARSPEKYSAAAHAIHSLL